MTPAPRLALPPAAAISPWMAGCAPFSRAIYAARRAYLPRTGTFVASLVAGAVHALFQRRRKR